MTITKNDIKVLESERLADTDDGGGRMTGIEVVDGQVNNLFNDISRLDRTIGRVSLRKVFVGVQTALNEVYAGSHVIVTNPPADDGVHVTLFSTGDDEDERTSAQNRVESYTVSGPLSRMRLYDRHVEGQRTLQVFQFPTDVMPEIGEIYAISKGEGTGSEVQQFFRIVKLTTQSVIFTESNYGQYTVRVINLEIDTALQHDFDGYTPKPTDNLIDAQFGSASTDRPAIRQTSIADASRYYGVVPIAEAVSENDVSIMAETVFSSVVPSTQAEAPITDETATLETRNIIQIDETFVDNQGAGYHDSGEEIEYYFGFSIIPGTLRVERSLPAGAPGVVTDDGNEGLVAEGGRLAGLALSYVDGYVKVATISSASDTLIFSATPGVAIAETATSKQVAISEQNRQLNYTDFLRPIPAPGTLSASFRALGKWYLLTDDGQGALVPDIPGTGGGTVNYATGSVALTVGFEPDLGSSVIFQWGTKAHYSDRSGDAIPQQPGITVVASEGHCEPGSVTISWESNSVAKSVTDDGEGNLTGDGEGKILYQTGQAYFVPDAYPDANFNISFAYDYGSQVVETFTPSKDGSGFIAMTAGTTPIKPGSVRVSWTTTRPAQVAERAANSGN